MISRLANWILYAVILAVIGALIYYYTDWFKPATQKAMTTAKSVVESIPVGPFSKKASDELLNSAREAYARGDVEASIKAYTEYCKKNPDSLDGNGELGNVYYMSGRLQEAAQSYFEAAKRLVEQDQMERAQGLLPSIAQGNPQLANDLQQLMMAKMSGQQAGAPQGQPAMPMPGPAPQMGGMPPEQAQQQPQGGPRYY